MGVTKLDYKERGKRIIEYALTLSEKLKEITNKDKDDDEELLESLNKAKEEWMEKEKFFNTVTEPDLIDYAIYDMEASKKKYTYFLKKVKEKDISKK